MTQFLAPAPVRVRRPSSRAGSAERAMPNPLPPERGTASFPTLVEVTPASIPDTDNRRPVYSTRAARWGMGGLGLACVALGALGVVVPGLPTTVFLMVASWCFVRSCPALDRWLAESKVFGRFMVYTRPGAVMPMRAKVISLVLMWSAIATSVLLTLDTAPWFVAPIVVLSGAVGSWFIVRQGRAARSVS